MKTEIVSSETIKPSSPTPINFRSFKLSVMDQLAPPMYGGIVFLYPRPKNDDNNLTKTLHSQKLKKSLSETLTHFYPLAGRIKDNISVECNDEGAVFIEARVHGILLSDFLKNPDTDAVKRFVPETPLENVVTGPLLLVQASFFDCGGLAIGVSTSHKLTDISTVITFVRAWAALSLHDGKLAPQLLPHYETTAFRFPGAGRDISVQFPLQPEKVGEVNDKPNPSSSGCVVVTKRFVFDSSKIAFLKVKAASETIPKPSRFESVMALIWKCIIAASTKSNSDLSLHVLDFAVNIRKWVKPPLPETTIGNLGSNIIVKTTTPMSMSLEDLVAELRKRIKEFGESKGKKYGGDPEDAFDAICQDFKVVGEMFARPEEVSFVLCSSWCNFKYYEADFGWSKPSWVVMACDSLKNMVRLIDTKEGDGVEAWVCLSHQDMEFFERDPQLLQFASLNPSV